MKKYRVNMLSIMLRSCMCAVMAATLLTTAALGNNGECTTCRTCTAWDTTIGQPGLNGQVRALAALSTGDLVAGGLFTMAGNMPADRIARWDGDTWHQMDGGVNNAVGALLELPNGDLIVGGAFTMAGNVAANRVARWDGDQWHALGGGLDNGMVWALAIMPDSGDVIAAGNFTAASGVLVNRIARWDGTTWHAMGDGMDSIVRSLAVMDNGNGPELYAGGDFVTAGGVEVSRIARWVAETEQWHALDQGVNGHVTAMTVFDDGDGPALYVAGNITNAGDVPLFNPIGKFDGDQWWPFSGGLNGSVQALTVFDDGAGPAMYAAVAETKDGQSTHRLIKWDGLWWVPLGDFNASAYAMAGGDVLYIAGAFTSAGGAGASYAASWRACEVAPPVLRRVPGEFFTIQAAINAADDGDVVLVGPGVYTEPINFLGKTIVVESEAGAEDTVIDVTGQNLQVAVQISAGSGVGTALRGFTVTGASNPKTQIGHGVRVGSSSVTVDACRMVNNGHQTFGGGLVIAEDADVLVLDSLIAGNVSQHNGAGVIISMNRHARLINCIMMENSSQLGSGAFVASTPRISYGSFIRCTFVHNNAVFGQPEWGTGAAGAISTGVAYFFDCMFAHNSAVGNGAGGGGLISGGETLVRACRFENNSATAAGGGLYLDVQAAIVLQDCIFSRNAASNGGGIYVPTGVQPPFILNTLFCENTPFDIAGAFMDGGGNTFADTCEETIGDLNGDGAVDVSDLLILMAAWGDCPVDDDCPADLSGDGAVDVSDLLILLSHWIS